MTKEDASEITERLRESITYAELKREEGRVGVAENELRRVIQKSEELQLINIKAEALAHLILCYKHQYQNTGEGIYSVKMKNCAEEGLQLELPEQEKAVFYLRWGDWYMMHGKYKEAAVAYDSAYFFVKKGDHTEAEYLGHLAEAKAYTGQCDEAIRLIFQALGHVDKCKDIRPFHRLVIVSGIHARKLKIAFKCRRFQYVFSSFLLGYSRAWWLLLRYRMPQRLRQFHGALFRK